MWEANPAITPLAPGMRLSKKDMPKFINPQLQRLYREIVGHLGFLVTMTRCDLAFSYAELSKFAAYPGQMHLVDSVKHVLRYLRGTHDRGITCSVPVDPKMLHLCLGWVDSDFAADPDTRRSVTGYVRSLNNGQVSWKSKRLDCVTLSSAEAEYVAASMCAQEVVYARALPGLDSFGKKQVSPGPTEVWEDKQSCIYMSENKSHRKYS
eukprot:3390497-Rhodomonas_salina.1